MVAFRWRKRQTFSVTNRSLLELSGESGAIVASQLIFGLRRLGLRKLSSYAVHFHSADIAFNHGSVALPKHRDPFIFARLRVMVSN